MSHHSSSFFVAVVHWFSFSLIYKIRCAFYVPTKIPDCIEFYIEITTELAPYVWWLVHDVPAACTLYTEHHHLFLSRVLPIPLSAFHCSFWRATAKEHWMRAACIRYVVDFGWVFWWACPVLLFFIVSSLFNSINCYSLKRIQVRIRTERNISTILTGQFWLKSIRQFHRFTQLRSTQTFNVATLHSMLEIHITICFVVVVVIVVFFCCCC